MNIQPNPSTDIDMASDTPNGARTDAWAPESVFADPVGFLAGLGVSAELIAETHLPAAA